MANGKHWKEVLKDYRRKLKAGSTNQKACVTLAMTKNSKLVGACKPIIGMSRIVCGRRISKNTIRVRTI